MNQVDKSFNSTCVFIVPTLRRAGAETQIIDLVNGLDSQFEPSLIAFERDLSQLDKVDQGRVHFRQYIRKSKYNFLFTWQIARYLDQVNARVVHCTMQFSLLVAWIALRFMRRKPIPKLVVVIHTTLNVGKKEEFLDQLLYRFLLKSCEQIVFVCHNQANYWYEKFPEIRQKSRVIYNGVDPEYFSPGQFVDAGKQLRESLGIDAGAKVIACIAGFRREKGHRNLVNAFACLAQNVHLLLAGDGPLRPEIEALVQEYGLSGRIHFLGNLNDVRPVLAASDLSVLASTAVETFSMAMLESMAMGVPVVATDIGGLNEAVLPGKTGDLVPIDDSKALSDALQRVLGDEVLLKRMSGASREAVVNRFSKARMIRSTEELLETVGEVSGGIGSPGVR